jgi:pimeloyl-ACP methyl ester carboxylesterase
MPCVKSGEQEIYYAARSNEFFRHCAPLVFVHGAGDTHLLWNGQLAAFADAARTLALDLPGHGRSNGAGRATIFDYAQAVRDFLTALEIERAVFVGNSMGGAIVQTLAVEFPTRVAGLVLVGTGAKLRVAPQFLQGLAADFENTARVLAENYFAPDAPALLRGKSYAQLVHTGSRVALGDFAACDAFDLRERIATISAPTLVICGAQDKMTPLRSSEYLAQHIPRAQLVVIPDAGHMPMLEQPRAFNAALRAWLATL